ncbi:MAG TPA: AbrB/MazE/SpoVT family DNA-binding domain-containing protein [Nitrososphaeraceae archaeon]|nr:AbrB/MazE/SpoVT family DNA-binding domain-containing protein [Nitrososphaeraceae archaeon]
MSTAAAPTRSNKKNIRLKRVIQFSGSTSLGITLPRAFVNKLGLKPGMLVSCELKNEDNTVMVEGLNFIG